MRSLVQQRVGWSPSQSSWYGWLVWYGHQPLVQACLELVNSSCEGVSEMPWEMVEELGTDRLASLALLTAAGAWDG